MSVRAGFFLRPTGIFLLCVFLGACSVIPGKKTGQEPAKNPCIVLALPDSGPYAAIASKIKLGAQTSREQLAKTGINARIVNINTEAPNWLAQLDALPKECAVVGGPMQEKSYVAAEAAGALEKRAFFSFMPTLKAGEEGRRAWRFFPSPQDQIDALLNFASGNLNINSYGSFYPADAYGQRMTRLLEQTLASRGMTLQKASYNPRAESGWNKAAEPLVRPITSPGKSPVPQTTFQAVLLPDSWKNIDRLTQSFLLNGEDRLVLMGTTLWEQNLSGKQVPQAQNYELAIFPGAWNRAKAPRGMQNANNDFWTALGYDFIRFAAHAGLGRRLTSAETAAAARRASASIQAMAPISYDNTGVAHQKLYLFEITSSGMKPLNEQEFKAKRERVANRAAQRIQAIQTEPAHIVAPEPANLQEETAPVREAAHESAVQEPPRAIAIPHQAPQTTPAAPLSTVPRPSYKLQLPTKK